VMQVDDVTWTSLSVSDSSNYPCDLNEVSVAFTPAITLSSSCVRFVEISGFTGTMTDDQSLTLTAPSTELVTSATWAKDAGSIQVFLAADLVAGTPYSFSFVVRYAFRIFHIAWLLLTCMRR